MHHKGLVIVAFVAGAYLGSRYYYYSPLFDRVDQAIAVIAPTKGNSGTGTVTFTQQKDGVHILGKLTGLPEGTHGFHIHEFGNCACDDGICAGSHYNPTNQAHAGMDDAHRHVGDLGNIIADAQGNALYSIIDTHVSLNGPHSVIGRTVIIHADADDLVSQPSGNAGARIACGVIGIAKK